jgi:hypothetical protein
MVEKAQKSHGAKYELNSVFGLEEVDRWNRIRTSTIQSRSPIVPSKRGVNLERRKLDKILYVVGDILR